MFRLFQSLFGARNGADGAWPEELVDRAIERAVDGTDPRLRVLGGYRKRLREPVIATIEHVTQLVDTLPAPVLATAENYRKHASLRAMFASPERMLEILGRDQNLEAALREGVSTAGPLTALMVMHLSEKRTLGIDLEDEVLKRDVQQTVVSFDGHRLVDPCAEETETRRLLKRRAFDHILAQVLAAMARRRTRRRELAGQGELLRRKHALMNGAGWSFEAGAKQSVDAGALEAEIGRIEQELAGLGPDTGTLDAHLELLAGTLAAPQKALWSEQRELILDHRNVLRAKPDSVARELVLSELHDARGNRLAMFMLGIDAGLLPRRDFFAAASRYTR